MEPEPLTFTAYAIGLVCVVAGSMQMRAIAFGSIAAKLLAAAGHESARAEKVRNGLAGVRAALTFATGCGLLALSRWTPVVTFSSILAQVAVHCWSQGAGLSRGAKGRGERDSPMLSYALQLAAFAFGLHIDSYGLWRNWMEPPAAELAVGSALTLAMFQVQLRASSRRLVALAPRAPRFGRGVPKRPPLPGALRLAPEVGRPPLWDEEEGVPVDPRCLGLGTDLVLRIEAWDAAFQSACGGEGSSGWFPVAAFERGWLDEGEEIAREMELRCGVAVRLQASALHKLIRAAQAAPETGSGVLAVRDAWALERGGLAEVRAALRQLDDLAREEAATPAGDGDTLDGIARFRALHQSVLAGAPGRYVEDIAEGLRSPHWRTRAHVALALASQAGHAVLPLLREAVAREDHATARDAMAEAIVRAEASIEYAAQLKN